MSEPDKQFLCCNFCGKSQHEVKHLIAGRPEAPVALPCICDECVSLCADILAEESAKDGVAAPIAPATKLVSMNMGGNLHDVARYVTKFGLSDFFVQAESSGFNSVILFRLPVDWPVDGRGPLPAAGVGQ